jgi:serine protease Do
MRTSRLFLVAVAVTLTSHIVAARPEQTPSSQPASRAGRVQSLQQLSSEFEVLTQQVNPAVVQVVVTGIGRLTAETPTTAALLSTQRSGGTGFILDASGFILTNAHVIEGARIVRVYLPAEPPRAGESIVRIGGPSHEARIVGVDRETDLAVLKIEAAGLPVLSLGNSDDLRPGQLVLAFGSPLTLDSSVTMGIVSAVGRQRGPEDPMVYIQTDAPINPGNSGGPLVDVSGRVMGVNTFILSQSGGSEGIGFAVPSNIVRTVYDQIRASGRVRRGTLGVFAQTVTPVVGAGLGLPIAGGAILGDVYPGGGGAAAGLEPGDVVLALDGRRIENGRQLDVHVYGRRVGDVVTLDVLRNGERKKFVAAVGERSDDAGRFENLVDPVKNLVPRLGILAVELSREVAAMLPQLRRPTGVLVAARAADAPTTLGQALLPGDVILAANGTMVASLEDLRKALARTPAGGACVLHVQRGPGLRFIPLELD